jgi:hypothetical protein
MCVVDGPSPPAPDLADLEILLLEQHLRVDAFLSGPCTSGAKSLILQDLEHQKQRGNLGLVTTYRQHTAKYWR